MSYVQYVIQVRNVKLFDQIVGSEQGFQDLLDSRDVHGNTCMHYLALFDDEEFIESVVNKISWAPGAIPSLGDLAEQPNNEGRYPLDHFFVGKSDSYELLHHFLTEQHEQKLGTNSPQSFTLSLIKKQLHNTKQMQKKSSFARLPSARTQASSHAPSSSMRRGASSKELNRSQKSLHSIRSNRNLPNFPLAPIQEQMQESDVLAAGQ